MRAPFDASELRSWRQGSVLGPVLAEKARRFAPKTLVPGREDWLVVTSHDCDVVNHDLRKEPFIELIRGRPRTGRPDSMLSNTRNPRRLEVLLEDRGETLGFDVHERWWIPRELLVEEGPNRRLDPATIRVVAEWLAKRYIRSAFPSEFDRRWRSNFKGWIAILLRHRTLIDGIYLRLDTLDELGPESAYRCTLLVAVDEGETRRSPIEEDVAGFWEQFEGIVFDGVEVLGLDEITLADLRGFQRFDADWISFDDGSDPPPLLPGS